MSPEPKKVSEEAVEASFGSLRGCLVDGDAEQRRKERSVRSRALAISILLQSAVVTGLVFVPLFGKGESIALANVTPIPPYGHRRSHPPSDPRRNISRQTNADDKFTFHPPTDRPLTHPSVRQNPADSPDFDPESNQRPNGPDCNWCVDLRGKNAGPRPPQPPTEVHVKPQLVRQTTIDPAMLIHRVEPIYPILAKQTHREGRVELRAIIGTDGTIQSLQIVAGDPLFQLSAREAVQQWRYRPTILNGQAVEIDTYITVVYTLQH